MAPGHGPEASRMALTQSLVEQQGLSDVILVDSAGTHSYHSGNPPDPRSQETAKSHGVDLSGLRARRFLSNDFVEFDYVIAMDESNMDDLLSICPAGYEDRVHLFLAFSDSEQSEVPDPYYGQGRGFEIVLNLVEDASEGLLKHIRKNN